MQEQALPQEEQYNNLVKMICQESAYKRKDTSKAKYMTVHEMGDLLGIRKTDRYWLVHKGFFKTEIICGKMMVEIASFEKWYANQAKYHKVSGEEPGTELKKESYSARDIAAILDISEWKVYQIMREANVEYIIVDYWKRYPKEAFDRWYQSQDKFRNEEDRKRYEETKEDILTMPEMARLLGVKRQVVYDILRAEPDAFEYVYIDGRKNILKESFYQWYQFQDDYKMVSDFSTPLGISEEENASMEVFRRKIYEKYKSGKHIGNTEHLTIREAAFLAGVDTATISKWLAKGYFQAAKSANVVRISRKSFEDWITKRKGNLHGFNC